MVAQVQDPFFTSFRKSIESFDLPDRFTYPFYYKPHALSKQATEELQDYLLNQTDWVHDFGLNGYVDAVNVGKMFGVLVVQNKNGEIGYLSAFSGKLAGESHHEKFVPPVVDILREEGFFRMEEKEIMEVNSQLFELLESEDYRQAKKQMEEDERQAAYEISSLKTKLKEAKSIRDQKRKNGEKELSKKAFQVLQNELNEESARIHYELKDLNRNWKRKMEASRSYFKAFEQKVAMLKKGRKSRSAALQERIFDQYQFLNQKGEYKSLLSIFETTTQKIPPSGAGECAAPKLLQYAFLHGMKPVAMAEFWWGQSPKSEIRRHGYFYPSCKGKCEPILGHMLKGMAVDESPIRNLSTANKKIDPVYEDEYLLVIHKPSDFLSVPGKTNSDSVYQRMLEAYPDATGPIMVHRLDRGTSGLMLIAKTKDTHKALQEQFLSKKIKKRYVALLDGKVAEASGTIELPLRPDLEDRPRQLVCRQYGKPALTYWEIIGYEGDHTRIHFFPHTGRTHQLRMHAAHVEGLGMPILGDELYGKEAGRLYLHAESITFVHPHTQKEMSIQVDPEF